MIRTGVETETAMVMITMPLAIIRAALASQIITGIMTVIIAVTMAISILIRMVAVLMNQATETMKTASNLMETSNMVVAMIRTGGTNPTAPARVERMDMAAVTGSPAADNSRIMAPVIMTIREEVMETITMMTAGIRTGKTGKTRKTGTGGTALLMK